LPYAPKAGRKGNILQVVSLIAQNCQEVIVTDGKYFPEIQGPYAPNCTRDLSTTRHSCIGAGSEVSPATHKIRK